MVSLNSVLPLVIGIALMAYENQVTVPTCEILPDQFVHNSSSSDVSVMFVADLFLLGSDTGYRNLFFTVPYMAKILRKSLLKLKPDMLIVLGDVSANGWKSANKQWLSVLHQFQIMMGPFDEIPLHIVVGDKEVGGCHEMDRLIDRAVNSLPGLGSAACGSFSINNVSFVSLNALAMACDQDNLRFVLERVIERESAELQQERKQDEMANNVEVPEEANSFRMCETSSSEESSHHEQQFCWRQNDVLAGTGPVVLLHHPLYRTSDEACRNIDIPKCSLWNSQSHNCKKSWASTDLMVFTAHTHRFCDRTHVDGTREITVPTMSWNLRDDPSFVVATFGRRNDAVTIQRCFLARESHLLMAYILVLISLFIIIISFWLDTSSFSYWRRTS
ncbi:uncharacterized protein LOC131064825 isoform X2 [Cryptomeria japonica]|uniref:uncharacterized protein LOC131064825 isoform X2 n=1 Tax=Cryptomeria japonica TaxID=3369 RepID=UPI0025AC4E56|nr:uncharacterized protein LOC131064825 isoform X2 [Cryptomeria japonica]